MRTTTTAAGPVLKAIMEVHAVITSITVGRARIRAPYLRNPQAMNEQLTRLQQVADIKALSVNSMVGSILVEFDGKATPVEVMRTRLEAALTTGQAAAPAPGEAAAVAEVTEVAEPPEPRRRADDPRPGVLNLGQSVKLGMLSSLGASLYWAVLGKKGPHKQTGALFLVTLAAHLWMYRNRLLK